ncbi:MAG: carboxypeptidase regulatory-like domain-containing protein [Burkholderiales bacterium]|nr:carboxypeptidase regulatory-like domain-containing protein [Burkholderiales bacterium]
MAWLLLVVAGTAAAQLHLPQPPSYAGAEIRGMVVDDATGAPLGGVLVVAKWQLRGTHFIDGVPAYTGRSGYLKVIETETDAAGAYIVPKWGPLPRPESHWLDSDPTLMFFKSGYYQRNVSNKRDSQAPIRESEHNGKTIRLVSFDGDYPRLFRSFIDRSPIGCWRDCPRYVLALNVEAKRLRKAAPRDAALDDLPMELEQMAPWDRSYFSQFR